MREQCVKTNQKALVNLKIDGILFSLKQGKPIIIQNYLGFF